MSTKNWGPFSGAHLTIMFVAAAAATLPGTLWAVDAFQNVVIEDPISGKKAAIDTGRRLSVYNPIEGRSAYAPYFVNFLALNPSKGVCTRVARAFEAGLVIKTIIVNTYINASPGQNKYFGLFTGKDGCEHVVMYVNPGGLGVTPLTIDPGVVVPAGQSLWVLKGDVSVLADVFAAGYTIPGSWAPATGAASSVTGSAQ